MSDSLLVDHKKAVFRRRLLVALQYAVAIVVTLIILFPIFWMLISSVKSAEELLLRCLHSGPRSGILRTTSMC